MAIAVKDAATASAKYVARAQSAAPDYQKGVTGSGAHWQTNTVAAQDAYVQGVTAAAQQGRFAKGVTAAGGAKFEQKASTIGAQRYPQGVAAAGPAWQNATAPFLGVIGSLTLPPRRPKGDPGNLARVQMVTDALRKKKISG